MLFPDFFVLYPFCLFLLVPSVSSQGFVSVRSAVQHPDAVYCWSDADSKPQGWSGLYFLISAQRFHVDQLTNADNQRPKITSNIPSNHPVKCGLFSYFPRYYYTIFYIFSLFWAGEGGHPEVHRVFGQTNGPVRLRELQRDPVGRLPDHHVDHRTEELGCQEGQCVSEASRMGFGWDVEVRFVSELWCVSDAP